MCSTSRASKRISHRTEHKAQTIAPNKLVRYLGESGRQKTDRNLGKCCDLGVEMACREASMEH